MSGAWRRWALTAAIILCIAGAAIWAVDGGPMLLIVGDADTTVPMEQTLQMSDKLEAMGVRHELQVLPGVNHGFLGKTQDATREANVKALAATFQFIDDIIGQPSRKR